MRGSLHSALRAPVEMTAALDGAPGRHARGGGGSVEHPAGPLPGDGERRQVDAGNQGQINGDDVNRQRGEEEEGSGPETPIAVRSLPVGNRVVVVGGRMRALVRVMMVLDFSHWL